MTKNTYPKRPPPPSRIELSPKEFDGLLQDQGTVVRITPALICPRRSGNMVERADSNHDLNCPICHGAMIIDLDEMAYETEAYIQGIKLERTFDAASRYDVKDSLITFRAKDRVSYYFKVEVIDFGSLYNEVLLKGTDDTDNLRYKSRDFEDGTFVIATDENGVRFHKDINFTITDEVLTWITPERPNSGKLYSLIYPINPTFRVLELIHETRYNFNALRSPVRTPTQLPQQAHCRWDYLMKRGNDVLINEGA